MPSRQQIYTLLILISASLMFGRILAVNRTDMQILKQYRIEQIPKQLAEKEKRLRADHPNINEDRLKAELKKTETRLFSEARNAQFDTPLLSANDRSRWDTIRALVEPEMRVVRTVKNADGTERNEYVWYAIDKVQNEPGWDTIDMVRHPLPDQPETGYLFSSKPPLLPTVLSVPYAVMFYVSGGKLSLANEQFLFLIVRTMLILCNLLPLVFCWFLLARLIDRFGTTDWGRIFSVAFICFGTFLSTFVVTLNNHLPAVVCVTITFYCAVRIVYDGETRRRYFIFAGLFGAFAVACELPALMFCVFTGLWLFGVQRFRTVCGFLPAALVIAAAFFAANYAAHQTLRPPYSQQDWYMFEYERGGKILNSHWKTPQGADVGEESRVAYIFHSAIGHHGIFSLTPVWILSFTGLGIWLRRREHFFAAGMILLTSMTVFVFYMLMEQPNRNYGGNTAALRWMFWLAPLWSVPLVTAADWCSRGVVRRSSAMILLMISVMSAAYPVWNPWSNPWAVNLLQYVELIIH
ncbi:MAG: hypothetical protein LBH00_04205 [Planctomycetaceae bacterium]|jgi:hypothetical protein|nr:hypothetical protein [Planctomycetaceae bacterium]